MCGGTLKVDGMTERPTEQQLANTGVPKTWPQDRSQDRKDK